MPALGVLLRRTGAFLVDAGLITVVVLPLYWWLAASGPDGAPLSLLVLLAALAVYDTAMIAGPRGATVGQRLLGLGVVTAEGGPVPLVQAVVYAVVFYGGVLVSSGLILVFPFFHRQRLTVHDLLAGVRVERRVGVSRAAVAAGGPR